MPKPTFEDQRVFALAALTAAESGIGEFISITDEGDGAVTYLFASTIKGYLDWRWSVTLYQGEGLEPTVSEIVLLPGENSLIAPDWVPWSERLADYKALQAELEAQAALDAEEAEAAGESEEDEDEDVVDDRTQVIDLPEDLEGDLEHDEEEALTASADDEEGVTAESDADDAGPRPPRSRGRNRGRNRKKKD